MTSTVTMTLAEKARARAEQLSTEAAELEAAAKELAAAALRHKEANAALAAALASLEGGDDAQPEPQPDPPPTPEPAGAPEEDLAQVTHRRDALVAENKSLLNGTCHNHATPAALPQAAEVKRGNARGGRRRK